jgi:hypothetical protein
MDAQELFDFDKLLEPTMDLDSQSDDKKPAPERSLERQTLQCDDFSLSPASPNWQYLIGSLSLSNLDLSQLVAQNMDAPLEALPANSMQDATLVRFSEVETQPSALCDSHQ